MSDMIERLAKAMFPFAWEKPGFYLGSEKDFAAARAQARVKAKTAIEGILTPTEDMIDRVAKAIFEDIECVTIVFGAMPAWLDLSEHDRAKYRETARAAIEAFIPEASEAPRSGAPLRRD